MNVLLATDGSIDARCAGDVLKRLPWKSEDRLVILSVVPPVHPLMFRSETERREEWRSLAEEERQTAEEIVRRAAGEMKPHFGSVETLVHTGVPAADLLTTAEEISADLVVVGSRGRSALAEWALGSVTRTVLEHSSRSLLIGRVGQTTLSCLLLAYDGSPESNAAVGLLKRLPLPPGVKVHLVGVVEPAYLPVTGGDCPLPEGYYEWLAGYNKQRSTAMSIRLERVKENLRAAGIRAESHPLVGDPCQEIVALAKRLPADLVMLGAHARHGILQDFLGNTARGIVHKLKCSVLVARSTPVPETSPRQDDPKLETVSALNPLSS